MDARQSTMLDAVIALTRDLRAAGVDASSAEAIDGLRAVEQVGVVERLLVRAALQATLVKRAEDLAVFELLFDRHFPPAPLLPPQVRDDEVAPGGAGAEVAPGSLGAGESYRSPSSTLSGTATTRRSCTSPRKRSPDTRGSRRRSAASATSSTG